MNDKEREQLFIEHDFSGERRAAYRQQELNAHQIEEALQDLAVGIRLDVVRGYSNALTPTQIDRVLGDSDAMVRIAVLSARLDQAQKVRAMADPDPRVRDDANRLFNPAYVTPESRPVSKYVWITDVLYRLIGR